MDVFSLKECCVQMLVKYEREEDATLLWIELPVILINTLLSRLFEGETLSEYATLSAYLRSPNMLTFVKAYLEKYYNADVFQRILLKAADMGDIRFLEYMLQNTPYSPHPKTMKRVFSIFRRRCKKTRRNEIYTIVRAWLSYPNSDDSFTCAGLCGV